MPELKTIIFIAAFIVAMILLFTGIIVAIARCANDAMDSAALDSLDEDIKED